MNGPSIDEADVEDRIEVYAMFERMVEDRRLCGPGIGPFREVLRASTTEAERRLRFRKAVHTLGRRGPDSAWARRQFRLIIGGRDDTEAA